MVQYNTIIINVRPQRWRAGISNIDYNTNNCNQHVEREEATNA